jgi:ethanolamine ammonia-lyase small subunit
MSEIPLAQSISARLRSLTPARVGLGRTGVSQQTRDVLAFQLAHAQARDAVHAPLDASALVADVAALIPETPILRLRSQATDRATYLQRPDLGRRLDENSRKTLAQSSPVAADLAIIVADGLSALAVERHAPALLRELLPQIKDFSLAPLCVVEQGRVAIGDEIGQLLHAQIAAVLIGERPGLSSPDSLGTYITWDPQPGRTDAERICISNIRAEGLTYAQAARQIFDALKSARLHRLTGVALQHSTHQLKEGKTP